MSETDKKMLTATIIFVMFCTIVLTIIVNKGFQEIKQLKSQIYYLEQQNKELTQKCRE